MNRQALDLPFIAFSFAIHPCLWKMRKRHAREQGFPLAARLDDRDRELARVRDREFSDDVGIEAMFSYTAVKDLTIFAGIAYEDTDKAPNKVKIFNLWASYAVNANVTLGGEFITQDDGGTGWLGFLGYKFDDKFSTAFRISTDKRDAGGNDQKYTIAPTYTVSPNLSFRAEYSLGRGDNYGDYSFFGVQAVLKF